MNLVPSMAKLINRFNRLPTIGPKTAQRLAFYVLKAPKEEISSLAAALLEVKERVTHCAICNNITEKEICPVCEDSRRDKSLICVVEQPQDIIAIERTREYKGHYHVLLGAISPLDGVGPEDLAIKSLIKRIKEKEVKEVIIATNPNIEGEATALYLTKILKPEGVKTTRIAFGLPVGGDLEYADEVTLARALEGRRQF
ncbi:recombination mediator RecR [bacterium]|nr:recombination mediator RecR [bacterium]